MLFNLPSIRNGAAKLIPMKGEPRYASRPKDATQASAEHKIPAKPRRVLPRTQSPILTAAMQKIIMMPIATPKYGMIELVLFSNSARRVSDVKTVTLTRSNSVVIIASLRLFSNFDDLRKILRFYKMYGRIIEEFCFANIKRNHET